MSNRRDFSRQILAAGAALAAPAAVLAQAGAPVEGQHFAKLSTPAPVSLPTPDKKVDVVEFFWYGCPHCNTLEPALDAWVKRLPADAAFRRVHVAFTALHETHARIYHALEALGQVETLHRRVFAAIHVQRQRLDKEADITAFMTANGVDGAKFKEAFSSFGVATKTRQGKQLSEAYKIDGVPALGVHGRWWTSPSLAGSVERAFATADTLIQRARRPA